jgi:hypothetical protein
MENKQQTAVEWLFDYLNVCFDKYDNGSFSYTDFVNSSKEVFEQAKEIEKQRMIDLVQSLKDYTHESHTILGHDERDASEFVEIYLNPFREDKSAWGQGMISDESLNHDETEWEMNSRIINEVWDKDEPKEDNVEKLAEISSELQEATYTLQHKITYKHGFIDGYNKAKDTLYTEEQVKEAIRLAHSSNRRYLDWLENDIIQSLKSK